MTLAFARWFTLHVCSKSSEHCVAEHHSRLRRQSMITNCTYRFVCPMAAAAAVPKQTLQQWHPTAVAGWSPVYDL